MRHAPLAPGRLRHYPNLRPGNYEVTSEEDPNYNCAAWAADDTQTPWWPQPDIPEYYWPTPRRENSLEAFIEGFGTLGYQVCDTFDLEHGYEKVAVYATTSGEPLHVARQRQDGSWTSKLGNWEDIRHLDLANLECDSYGEVALVMRRPRAEREEANAKGTDQADPSASV